MRSWVCGTIAVFLSVLSSQAAEHEVRMLNYGAGGSMVFEPAFLKIEPGDTVTFIPENSGHYVQSVIHPDGASAWKSKPDERYSVMPEAEGIYLYVCPPHMMMSMIGIVQVGRASNREAVIEKTVKLRSKLVMKGERLDAILEEVGK